MLKCPLGELIDGRQLATTMSAAALEDAICVFVQNRTDDRVFDLRQIRLLCRVSRAMHCRVWRVMFWRSPTASTHFPLADWQRCRLLNVLSLECVLFALHQRTMGCDAFNDSDSITSKRVTRIVPLCPPPRVRPNAWLCILPPFAEPTATSEIVGLCARWLVSVMTNPELIAWMCSRGCDTPIRHLWTRSTLQVDAHRRATISCKPSFTRLIPIVEWLALLFMIGHHSVALPLLRPAIEPSALSVLAMLHFLFNIDTDNGRFALVQILSVLLLSFGALVGLRMSGELALWTALMYTRHVESAHRGGGEAEIAVPRIDNATLLRALAATMFFACELAWAALLWLPLTAADVGVFAVVCALLAASMLPSVQVRMFVTRSESFTPSWSVETEYGDPIAPLRPYRLARASVWKLRIGAVVTTCVLIGALVDQLSVLRQTL